MPWGCTQVCQSMWELRSQQNPLCSYLVSYRLQLVGESTSREQFLCRLTQNPAISCAGNYSLWVVYYRTLIIYLFILWSFAFNNKSLRVATVSVASNRFRTCFACTVAKVTEYFMSHPSSDLCIFSRSSAKFWQPANLTTYTILYLFSVHVEPTPHLLPP